MNTKEKTFGLGYPREIEEDISKAFRLESTCECKKVARLELENKRSAFEIFCEAKKTPSESEWARRGVARESIRVCEWWDSTLVQTTRTNRITAESIIVGVVIKKKSVSVETLSTFL